MKNIKLLSIFAASSLFLGSCADNQNDTPVVDNPVKSGEEVLFGSSLPKGQIQSRTIYGDEESTGGEYGNGYFHVYWENGDNITILCPQASNGTRVDYTITPLEGDKTTSADVTKVDPTKAGLQWGAGEEHEFFAFYPAEAITGEAVPDDGIVTVNIPVEQDPVRWEKRENNTWVGIADTDYAYMWAYNKVEKSKIPHGTSIPLPFKPMTTVLEITINGPKSSSQTVSQLTVTSVAPASADNPNTILSGLIKCNIRAAAENNGTAICETAGNLNEVRNRIAVNLYNAKGDGKYPTLSPGEKLKVYVSIMPKDESIEKGNLKVTVAGVNTPAKEKTLQTADIKAHAINKVSLPALDATGSQSDINYWMSNLDPDIYYSELSLPGSKMSMATVSNNSKYYTQKLSLTEQFNLGIRAFDFKTVNRGNTIYVATEQQLNSGQIATLESALRELADCLDKAESTDGMGDKNLESVLVNISYAAPRLDLLGIGDYFNHEDEWINAMQDNFDSWSNTRVLTTEMNNETTLGDVKGKIIVRVHVQDNLDKNWYSLATNMRTQLVEYSHPYLNGNDTPAPMAWGSYNNTKGLKLFYQEASRLDGGGTLDFSKFDGTIESKKMQVEAIVKESVKQYNENAAHDSWYMMDLGGYFYKAFLFWAEYNSVDVTAQLTPDFFKLFNNREQNASLGAVYMNFADNDPDYGAKYGCDQLIQTVINNNFTFQLRTRGNSTYTSPQTRSTSAGNDDPNAWD